MAAAVIVGVLTAGVILSSGTLGCPSGFMLVGEHAGIWNAHCVASIDRQLHQIAPRMLFT